MLARKDIHGPMASILALVAALALIAGCGYYLVPDPFQPLQSDQQTAPGEGTRMEVYDDGTVAFIQSRLEISARVMTDDELNRQFAAESVDVSGPANEMPTNAFTYGEWKDPATGNPPQRFTILKVNIKNYEYPKTKFDPLKTVIHSGNGRSYYPWGRYDVEEYFRRFALAYNGLAWKQFRHRIGMIRQAQYPEDEFVFSGQDVVGYIIFPQIHVDVAEITFEIPAVGIRYDFRNEPVETMDLTFRFKRNLHKVKTYDELAGRK